MATNLADTCSRIANKQVDGAGLAAFRILFATTILYSTIRFWAKGWIYDLYIEPNTFFPYFGLDWIRPWPGNGMYLHFAIMAVSAFFVLLGAWTRFFSTLLFFSFTYVELIDKSTYLNHYYLVSILSFLLIFVPANRVWSVDSKLASAPSPYVGQWAYLVLRAQIALVYLFAGVAKLSSDWLFHAQPLRTWLQSFAETPIIGTLFAQPLTAFAMSWFGAFFDLTIVFWLLWKPSRKAAYAVCVAFHIIIWLLFPIGVFSFVMLAAATVFFSPAWPRRGQPVCLKREPSRRLKPIFAIALSSFILLQVALPLRHYFYSGTTNWTESGFRFAWRVMLIEKTGMVDYKVRTSKGDFAHIPRKELSALQSRMLSTQPDMIGQYAKKLADDYRSRGYSDVRVYANAWSSLNGRPSQRLLPEDLDLASNPVEVIPLHPVAPQPD